MALRGFTRRPLVRACVVVGVFLVVAGHTGRAGAQWDVPPADRAELLWRQGYLLHLFGAYEQAVAMFRRSIADRPTAEGHTFLGWSLSHMGQLDGAIAECEKAIAVDPDFGNPYNDIGAYLIELGREDEAIPWLRKAIRAGRYCCYQFPNFNLGKILLERGEVAEAKHLFERALEYDPDYAPANRALEDIRDRWL